MSNNAYSLRLCFGGYRFYSYRFRLQALAFGGYNYVACFKGGFDYRKELSGEQLSVVALIAVIVGAVAVIKSYKSACALYGELYSVYRILNFLSHYIVNGYGNKRKRSSVSRYFVHIGAHIYFIGVERGEKNLLLFVIVNIAIGAEIASYRKRLVLMERHCEAGAELVFREVIYHLSVIHLSAVMKSDKRKIRINKHVYKLTLVEIPAARRNVNEGLFFGYIPYRFIEPERVFFKACGIYDAEV